MNIVCFKKVPKPAKPEPKRACLEITNYKSQITNKLQIPMAKITNSSNGLLRTLKSK
jgi:hypothetical protein